MIVNLCNILVKELHGLPKDCDLFFALIFQALPIFLRALTTPYHRDIIHAGVRQYLHRMIICLGDELLPYLPIAVTHLLKDCEVRDIQEFIPLVNQLIARFKVRFYKICQFLYSSLSLYKHHIDRFRLYQMKITVNQSGKSIAR